MSRSNDRETIAAVTYSVVGQKSSHEIANNCQETSIMVKLTPTPGYSLAVRLQMPNQAGMLAKVMQAIGSVGGNLGEINLIQQTPHLTVRDITIDATSTEHDEQIVNAIKEVPD